MKEIPTKKDTKTFEEQIKANRIIDGKDITEHPLYPFNEAYTARELCESHLYMAIKASRAGQGILTLEDITRILRETLPAEELAVICRNLLIKEN